MKFKYKYYEIIWGKDSEIISGQRNGVVISEKFIKFDCLPLII